MLRPVIVEMSPLCIGGGVRGNRTTSATDEQRQTTGLGTQSGLFFRQQRAGRHAWLDATNLKEIY